MEDHESSALAVVTGAASAIGRALASEFAAAGFDLVIAADDERIQAIAFDLQAAGVRATGVKVDLSTYDGVEALHSAVRGTGRTPEAVVINAGVGVSGDFARENDLASELRLVGLNVTGAVHLAKLMLAEMTAMGTGGLLFTSSIAATPPGPYHATYVASKAFLLSFAEALRYELRDTGVRVTALMPGQDDPAAVARQGVEALLAGKDHVVAGPARYKAQFAAGRVLSHTAQAWIQARQAEPQRRESD
jgi:short-subunit dehydrogenase